MHFAKLENDYFGKCSELLLLKPWMSDEDEFNGEALMLQYHVMSVVFQKKSDRHRALSERANKVKEEFKKMEGKPIQFIMITLPLYFIPFENA